MLAISLTCFITTYAQHKFVQMREYTIGKRLFESYLDNYSWFKSSYAIFKNVLSEIQAIS